MQYLHWEFVGFFFVCVFSFVVVLKKDECMLRYTTPCALVDAIATQPACKAN